MSLQDVQLTKLYKRGLTGRKIAETLGKSPTWVSVNLKRLGLKANSYTSPETKKRIRELYSAGIQVREIIQELGIDKQIVYKFTKDLTKLGNQKHKIDHKFFDSIGPKQSYFIGFFLADGHLQLDYNRIVFGLSVKDISLLETFQKWLKTDYPIKVHVNNSFGKPSKVCSIQFLSQRLTEKALKMNMHLNKCTELKKFPTQVETFENFPYALKGFIDGDGWISKKGASRKAIEIISNPDICSYLQDYLMLNYGISSSIKEEKRCNVKLSVIRFFGENFDKLMELLPTDLGMQRKIER